MLALKPLHDAFGLDTVHVVTMQAISGAGYPGVSSLDMLDNVVPFIGGEEEKLETETRKILGLLDDGGITDAEIIVSAQCNRVAVLDGHTECVSVKLAQPAQPSIEIIEAWEGFRRRPAVARAAVRTRPTDLLQPGDAAPQPRLHRDAGSRHGDHHRPAAAVLRSSTTSSWSSPTTPIRGAAGGSLLAAELAVSKRVVPSIAPPSTTKDSNVQLTSTNGQSPPATFKAALFQSLAADGGLYTPRTLSPLTTEEVSALRGAAFQTVAKTLAGHLLGDEFDAETVDAIVEEALDFPIPLVDRSVTAIRLLELFHGPTLAFKDVGARFMARVMQELPPRRRPLTVLVATSGDTGSAVAHAFLGLQDTRIVVLFPDGQVSALQERQFTTLGDNVRALAVQGTFDDCQRLAKAAFADDDLRRRVRLTSANSINIGRLLPQIFYYFGGVAQLPPSDREFVFCTPSGNFGNLTAGLMAKRLGLPASRLVAATNVNDVLPGVSDDPATTPPRPSQRTISNAMDVGDPSNLARIIHLYDQRPERLLGQDLAASSHNDDGNQRRHPRGLRHAPERCSTPTPRSVTSGSVRNSHDDPRQPTRFSSPPPTRRSSARSSRRSSAPTFRCRRVSPSISGASGGSRRLLRCTTNSGKSWSELSPRPPPTPPCDGAVGTPRRPGRPTERTPRPVCPTNRRAGRRGRATRPPCAEPRE